MGKPFGGNGLSRCGGEERVVHNFCKFNGGKLNQTQVF